MNSQRIYRLSDFNINVPEKLIAQYPADKRIEARLFVCNKAQAGFEHRKVSEIVDFIFPGDVLVMNNTRVIPARIYLQRSTGGNVEMVLTKKIGIKRWTVICNRTSRLRPGEKLYAKKDPSITLEIIERYQDSLGVEFEKELDDSILSRIGEVPLPPYIRREFADVDKLRYQTVFAAENGSAAAPTAGLHFSHDLLKDLEKRGIEIVYLTLDVSWGTFQPVRHEDLSKHVMHSERYSLTENTAEKVNRARQEGRRIIAVGTTTVRVLESTFRGGVNYPGSGETSLFIRPPARVNSVDALLTNFHTPGSTLLMLVAAFAGYELTMSAYDEAIKKEYRFFSYGDAMFIQ